MFLLNLAHVRYKIKINNDSFAYQGNVDNWAKSFIETLFSRPKTRGVKYCHPVFRSESNS